MDGIRILRLTSQTASHWRCVVHRSSLPGRRYSSNKSDKHAPNPLVRYVRALKWFPLPLGVGFALIAYQQYGHVRKREQQVLKKAQHPENLVATDWQVKFYTLLPMKAMSRLWGRVNNVVLPTWMRKPLLGAYVWAFNCNLEEAAVSDLRHYKNLGEFFRRRLTPDCRPVNKHCSVTSPSDGKILHFGKVENGLVEQIKGVTYSMETFLGPSDWSPARKKQDSSVHNAIAVPVSSETPDSVERSAAFHSRIKTHKETELYHCVIYLAPGDYHGFHSPVDWVVQHRRHFPGELLSVNPGIVRWVRGLFNINERAVYLGSWRHGFFAMAAVGATNVGSIKIFHDRELVTNTPGRYSPGTFHGHSFCHKDSEGVAFQKGAAFGEFNLGSTIVIVFEAPSDFQFIIKPGQRIKFGQPLTSCQEHTKGS